MGRTRQTAGRSSRDGASHFLAIEADFFPNADKKGFPTVEVEDEADHWSVFRPRPAGRPSLGDIEVTMGGGQLSLSVAKCDAAISNVQFGR